jgi:hypothetical protein
LSRDVADLNSRNDPGGDLRVFASIVRAMALGHLEKLP